MNIEIWGEDIIKIKLVFIFFSFLLLVTYKYYLKILLKVISLNYIKFVLCNIMFITFEKSVNRKYLFTFSLQIGLTYLVSIFTYLLIYLWALWVSYWHFNFFACLIFIFTSLTCTYTNFAHLIVLLFTDIHINSLFFLYTYSVKIFYETTSLYQIDRGNKLWVRSDTAQK